MRFQIIISCFMLVLGRTSGETDDIPEFLKYKEGQKYFFYPDHDGKLQLINLLQTDAEVLALPKSEDFAYFQLYTRENPVKPHELIIGDVDGLNLSNFNKKKSIKIIIHGWQSNVNGLVNTLITKDFLSISDVNVICVDWGYAANGLYTTAVNSAPKVGKTVAKLIDWLRDEGVPMVAFHLMGHSIGAHIAGIAARSVSKGLISIVTGFDPASPLWSSSSERIRKTDAIYVEIIHTNAGSLGLTEPLGDNDFYPNGGSRQPGCSFLEIGCSHSRSYEFFADSLDHQFFTSAQCIDYNELYYGKCSNISETHMGGSQVKKGNKFLCKNLSHPPDPKNGPLFLEKGNHKYIQSCSFNPNTLLRNREDEDLPSNKKSASDNLI